LDRISGGNARGNAVGPDFLRHGPPHLEARMGFHFSLGKQSFIFRVHHIHKMHIFSASAISEFRYPKPENPFENKFLSPPNSSWQAS
jgi:hypothetical protein